MIIEMEKRKYTKKLRADRQQQTRERIVDAAMFLHEELGPAATTISALAEHAGVQRLTVYRHFENDEELFKACTSKWLGLNPPPQLPEYTGESPVDRTQAFLLSLYRYYRRTSKMWTGAYRDVEKVPSLAGPMKGFDDYLAAIARELVAGWAVHKPKRLQATLGHAVQFAAWRSLSEQKLSDRAMADLVCTWVRAVTESR
jgi:AcrR family transcriptional regulator